MFKVKKDIQSKAELLEKSLTIKDRKWHLKTYKNCFIGSEAVETIIDSKIAASTYGAIIFGNKLITTDLIVHVENEHIFKNERLYYQFTEKYKKAKIKYKSKNYRDSLQRTAYKGNKRVSFATD
eukprot:264581_1